MDAVALYDFVPRTPRELAFRRGDVLHIHFQVSSEWWRGSCRGQEGLIPDNFIMLNLR